MEAENQLKEVGLEGSILHILMIVGERVDGPNEMGCSPLLSPRSQTRYPAIFSQIFDVEHQTQELWGSSWWSRSLTLIFDMDLESWHAQKHQKNSVMGMILCTNKDNTKRTTAIHPPSTNIITQPCDLVFSAKQLLQTSRRNLLISPHAQVQVLGSDGDIGSRGTFPWETARSWGLEV